MTLNYKIPIATFGSGLIFIGTTAFFHTPVFGLFFVNQNHALLLMATGILGIGLSQYGNDVLIKFYQLFGIFFAWLTVWGFTNEFILFNVIQINAWDHVLHFTITAIFLYIGFVYEQSTSQTDNV